MKNCNCKTHPFDVTRTYTSPRSPKDTNFPHKNISFANQTPDWSWYINPRNGTPRQGHYRRSILRDLVASVAQSAINGFNRMCSADNWCQRIVWMLVLVMCLLGFGFQAFHFLKLYYAKPSVVQIEVEKESQVEFPAITFCNNNRFRKSEFCDYFPKKCFGMFADISISDNDVEDVVYNLLAERKSEEIYKLGHTTDMLQECTFNGEPEVTKEECRKMLKYSYDPDYGNCFTIPSRNLKGQLLKARESDFWQEANELSILIDVEADELMEKRKVPGVVLTVHDDSILPDMLTDGNLFTPGSTHVVSIKKSSIHLLPYPFKTNCTHFSDLPWQKNYKKNLYPKLCTVGCSQYFQQKTCNFITKNLSLFFEELPYDPKKVTEDAKRCAENEEKKTQGYCRSICGLPCRKNLVLIKVRFSTLEQKIFRHIPKYDTMELFSYLGGYSGVWLGFSLLTVYEMAEILLSAVVFAFQKYLRTSKYRRVLRDAAKPRRKRPHGIKKTKRLF